MALKTLALHRMSTESGCCAACHRPCPCEDANAAANTLLATGYAIMETDGPTTDVTSGSGPGRGVRATWLSWLRGGRP